MVTLDFECRETQELFEIYVAKKAICCFSRDKKNILMWSHYTDSHKGFCIGLDETMYTESNLLSAVSYRDLDQSVVRDITGPNVPGEINKSYEKLLTHKHEDWKYEKEVRVILELPEKNLPGKIIPLSENQIKEVYFGCRMPEKNKQLIKKIMGKKVKYHKMETSKIGFYLIETPL